jgi:PmbA protein
LIAKSTVEYALKSGANEVEVYVTELEDIRVHFTSKDKKILVTNETGLGVRVAIGKRLGFVSTSILSEEKAKAATIKALKIAKASPEDPHWSGFNKKWSRTSVKGLYDKAISELSSLELVERVDNALNTVSDYDSRVKPAAGAIETTNRTITYANSYIDELTRRSTLISGYMYTKAEENGKQSTGSEDDESRKLSDFNFEKASLEAAIQSVEFLDAKPSS